MPPVSRPLSAAVIALLAAAVCRGETPHPAVARIVAPENGAVAYGSGSLIDVRDQYGLVITNWHVVRDATGPIEVIFPSGFRSEARKLKLDADWDLAALVIWRPPVEPIPLATHAPRPGDPLTICGYGSGEYRSATGRCTDYFAPKIGLPHELVELSVEARQGDSGGPILNAKGQIAGVLFGAGQGTTLGSFGGRVENFLATLAPDIGHKREPVMVAAAPKPERPAVPPPQPQTQTWPADLIAANPTPQATAPPRRQSATADRYASTAAAPRTAAEPVAELPPAPASAGAPVTANIEAPPPLDGALVYDNRPGEWLDQGKTIFAAIGVLFVLMQLVRLAT